MRLFCSFSGLFVWNESGAHLVFDSKPTRKPLDLADPVPSNNALGSFRCVHSVFEILTGKNAAARSRPSLSKSASTHAPFSAFSRERCHSKPSFACEMYFILLSVRKQTKHLTLVLPRHDALLRSWLGSRCQLVKLKPPCFRVWKSIPASQRDSILSPTRQNYFAVCC